MSNAKKEVLVVDDLPANLKIVQEILQEKYSVVCASSGEEALVYLSENIPSIILLDIKMPVMDGFEFMDSIRSDQRIKDVPVIFLTASAGETEELRALELGAVDFIKKPFVPQIMLKRVETHIELHAYQSQLEDIIKDDRAKIERMSIETVVTIIQTVEAKDRYTQKHSRRVAEYSATIAKMLGWNMEAVKDLYIAGLLHDIGKIAIPDGVLNKRGSLTDEEYAIMKTHVTRGAEIIKYMTGINGLMDGVLYHHERYDGTGYCAGLKGDEIPLFARIIGIADSLDAMTSDRVYRVRLPVSKVLRELENGRGTQFDPNLVDLGIKLAKERIFKGTGSQNHTDNVLDMSFLNYI